MKKYFFILLIILMNLSYAMENSNDKLILGQIEKIRVTDHNILLEAKIDTGATISSLSATSIKIFHKNNKQWVSFVIPLKNKPITISAPLVRFAHILKRHENSTNTEKKYEIRPVILLPICVANQKELIPINLIDRTHFQYPMLIGKDAIEKINAYVDVKRKFITAPICH